MAKLYFLIAILPALLFFQFADTAYAGSSSVYGSSDCQTYGSNNCESVSLLVDKKIADPTTVDVKGKNPSNYQDNWGPNTSKYVPGQHVPFQITVKNTGTKTLTNLTVKDILPQYIKYVSGGSYDGNAKTVVVKIDKLTPNESKTVDIVGQIVSSGELPSDQTIVCGDQTTNQAIVTVDSLSEKDNAQLCIQKEAVGGVETKGGLKVFPAPKATTTPPTGPELLGLIALLPAGIGGLILRRKSQIHSGKIAKTNYGRTK